MLNLNAWNVYMGILCVLLKIDEEWCCCCWIVDEFMVNCCCCCCYKLCCWWIDAMSFHNYGIVVWIELLLWVFVKLCGIVELCWNDVLISYSIWFWVSFYVHIPVNNLWERIWTLGDQNLGFRVKKGWNPREIVSTDDWSLKRAPSVQSLQASGAWLLKRVDGHLSERA